jgi:4,5-dihydroxyphthalate decarboxylase
LSSKTGLQLGFAGRDYDRTRALIDKRVVPQGIDLNYVVMEDPELIFKNMLEHGEYDSCEFSLSTYISLRARGDARFRAIPVFPSRLLRHSFIFCNVDAGVNKPSDLVGKKVGLMEWQQTSAVWIKGILQDEYGVSIEKIKWIRFKGDRDSKSMKLTKFDVEPTPDLNPDTADQRASRSIESGEIDALVVARTPASFRTGKKVKRLFEDPVREESKYYEKTRIFPIMHTVVIKSDIYRRNEWIGPSLLDAFSRAKEIGYKYLEATGDRVGAVWIKNILETQNKLMGRDIYPYNLQENRKVIDTLIRYQFEQEIIEKPMDARELFVENTL